MKKRVLIIDNIKFVSINLKNILISLNSDVLFIEESSNDAIKRFNNNHNEIDIIFLNLHIPQTNEFPSVTEIIKELLIINENITIIMITPTNENESILKAIQTGAKGFVEKPLSKEAIQKVLHF